MTTLTMEQVQHLLTNLPVGDKIELIKTPGGKIDVTSGNGVTTKDDILKEKFSSLMGQQITLSEAAKKYNIPRATLESWIYRSNYIQNINDNSYPMTVDEAEVAYCAEIYQDRRAIGSKAPLLDENGLPYEIKHPDRAEAHRRKNKI